ncbi:MAG TPA: cadmium resistance transporter [Pseudonocardiaceae bacterium]|jgi:cadmium resistance protein CadD (predicted permease)|nr:cadmium resistance transporter [Pseudonocardiaceae bacterium]
MTVSLLAAALVAFLGTTVDDVIVVTTLFMDRRVTGRPAVRTIVAGQYVGFGAVLVLALLAATGLQIVPVRWAGLLGLVPIGLGIWGLWRLGRNQGEGRAALATTVSGIAAITFADGADNIGVFTPLFRTMSMSGSVLTTVLFLVLTGVLCAVGATLGGHRTVVALLGRVASWLVPVVFIAVGAMILVSSGILATIWPAL